MRDLVATLMDAFRWQDIVEIGILSFIFYKLLVFMKATRAFQVLKGIGILVVLAFVSRLAELHIINSIIWSILGIGAIGIIIVFQPELRRALARVGHNPVFRSSVAGKRVMEKIVESTVFLGRRKRGALIVLERNTGLEDLIETGVKMDSEFSTEIVDTIFTPRSPLHDGAIVIRGDRIAAAACIIPFDERNHALKSMGTRHLAAISLSHNTDAVAIIVSEETGEVSIAVGGKLRRKVDRRSLREALGSVYLAEAKPWWGKLENKYQRRRKACEKAGAQ